jgi:hypothetical protein
MKKLSLFTLSLLIVAGLLLSGCTYRIVTGSGNVSAETYDLTGYTRVTLAGIGDVILTQEGFQPVRIEAEDNLIPYFEVKVEGDSLVIGIRDEYLGVNLRPTRPVKFYVSLPEVEALTLAGSGNVLAGDLQTEDLRLSLLGSGNVSTGDLDSAALDVNLAGSGDIRLQTVSASEVTLAILGSGNVTLDSVSAGRISSAISGSGDVTLTTGQVEDQEIEILGSGDYLAAGMESQTARVTVSGSGNTQIRASDSLEVNILGSGDVRYTGQPAMDVNISGSGSVSQVNE